MTSLIAISLPAILLPAGCAQRGAMTPWEVFQTELRILARETHFHFETQDRPDATLAQVLRGSPRPVVIAPRVLPDGPIQALAHALPLSCRRPVRDLMVPLNRPD